MNGLKLSREYFNDIAKPGIWQDFPDLYPRLAAGLVGNGSECFGYDDEISRDHDWGVDFYIWTLDDDSDMIPALQDWKTKLFDDHPPEYPRIRSEYGARVNVMTCSFFYNGLVGAPAGPQSLKEWLRAPEEHFALAVNGEVFFDGPGEFTNRRDYLLDYYPEDIRRKKIAAKCMALAQTGQYNHERTAKRRDWVTLRTVLSRYTENVIAIIFLLNKVYRPYYKLAFRAMKDLPVLGFEASQLLLKIAETGNFDDESFSTHQQCISELCGLIASELRTQRLSESDDWFLTTHGEEIQSKIEDSFLRSLPTQYEI